MHSTGEPGRPPVKVGVAATDIATGLYAHGAIMAALISRQQSNKGVWIDCNLFESQVIISYSIIQNIVNYLLQIAGLANIASNYLIAGQEALRHGTAHPSIVPYEVFPCKNGYLMIGAGNNKQVRAPDSLDSINCLLPFVLMNANNSSGYWPKIFSEIPH